MLRETNETNESTVPIRLSPTELYLVVKLNRAVADSGVYKNWRTRLEKTIQWRPGTTPWRQNRKFGVDRTDPRFRRKAVINLRPMARN